MEAAHFLLKPRSRSIPVENEQRPRLIPSNESIKAENRPSSTRHVEIFAEILIMASFRCHQRIFFLASHISVFTGFNRLEFFF